MQKVEALNVLFVSKPSLSKLVLHWMTIDKHLCATKA